MSNEVPGFHPDLTSLKCEWGWLVGLGAAMTVMGGVAIAFPLIATIGFVEVLGIVMALAGVAQVIGAFYAGKWKGFLLHMVLGVLYAVTGFLILENPIEGAAGVTLIAAAFFLTGGIFRIILAMSERFAGWGWMLANGVITVLMGLIIWRQFPESALWVIGLLVGIEMLFSGWVWMMLGLTIKSLSSQNPPPAAS